VLAGPNAELFELRETAVNRVVHWRNNPQSRELLRGLPMLNSLALQQSVTTGSLLWLGSEAGIWRTSIRPDGTAEKPSQHGKGPSRVLTTTANHVWVHRGDSLLALDSDGRVLYSYPQRLKPHDGDLWASNPNLLVCVQGSGSPWPGRVLVFRLGDNKVAHTDTLWRLRLAQVAFTSAHLDADNRLWVGAYERVICLPLGTQPIPRTKRNPSFEAFFRGIFRIGNGLEPLPLAATQQPELDPGQHVFQFNFGANDFLLPDGGFFEVELNSSGNWIPVPGTTYTLPLAEGTHQLQVRSVNALGQLSQTATYSVVIPPPWYRTQWFVALAILGFIGIGYGAYSLRVRSIRRQNKELERQVQARTEEIRQRNADLQAQKDELEAMNEQIVQQTEQLIEREKMAALGQLVSSVAHEINTPLGAIKGAAVSMHENLPLALQRFPVVLSSLSEAERTLLLGLIERAIHNSAKLTTREERSLRLELEQQLEDANVPEADELAEELVRIGVVKDILIFVPLFRHPRATEILHLAFKTGSLSKNLEIILSAIAKTQKTVLALKSYSFQQSNEAQSFDLSDNIDTILTLFSNRLKQGAGVELRTEYAEGVRLQGWPDRLGQVWTNLLDNALHAIMKHPPADGPQLRICMTRNDQTVRVSITDNGPGIPSEIQDKIFQQFYTTKAKGEGTGLGLYICRQIVAEHGGTLTVESQPGQTTFWAEFQLHI
jgi:signal transduction histidine kinase